MSCCSIILICFSLRCKSIYKMNMEEEQEWEQREQPEELEERESSQYESSDSESSNSEISDLPEEYSILGNDQFQIAEQIEFYDMCIANATTFPASLSSDNLSPLDSLKFFPKWLLKGICSKVPSWFPVQTAVIPVLLRHLYHPSVARSQDVLLSSPTGSGKTLSYIIPCLAAAGEKPRGLVVAVVVAPVQTLVYQIKEEFEKYNVAKARILAFSGAEDLNVEMRVLAGENDQAKCDIVISTPRRLVSHLLHREGKLDLSFLRFLVADEADRMGPFLRLEWLDTVERCSGGSLRARCLNEAIASKTAPRKVLVSATIVRNAERLHMWNLYRPLFFHASDTQKTPGAALPDVLILPENLEQHVIYCKLEFHPLLVATLIEEKDKVLIFTNKKASARILMDVLGVLGQDKFTVENLTSNMFGRRRAKVLDRFTSGQTRVLICSDVLSRGIDISGINLVINYNAPENERLYVHRAGRTARAGHAGKIMTVLDKKDKNSFVRMMKGAGFWTSVIETNKLKYDFGEDLVSKYERALIDVKNKQHGGFPNI